MNWFKPTNPKLYNHKQAFQELKTITWTCSTKKIEVGDIVYIYSSYTEKRLTHKCIVEKVNVSRQEIIDDNKYVLSSKFDNSYQEGKNYINLRLIEELNKDELNYEQLMQHGLKTTQSMNRMTEELKEYIEKICNLDDIQYYEEREFLKEGKTKQVFVNLFERNSKARQECINYYGGYQCQICRFDFEKVYGELGRHFIEVHHKIPLSKIGKNYIVNPKKDLLPVCPNCHAMLHRKINGEPIDYNILKNIINNI